jgi:hypothetical protein
MLQLVGLDADVSPAKSRTENFNGMQELVERFRN